ncbi:MAG: hypothetical protein PHY34_05640 [Patescibacteria group bacterium]|nr:hypothetical protein [Patescibacteria group bacterium]MDD5715725.1 hypothetical protein [Patescibacteria group bacterium]
MFKRLLLLLAVMVMVMVFGESVSAYPNPFNANISPGCSETLTNLMSQTDQNSPPAEINVQVASVFSDSTMVSSSPPANFETGPAMTIDSTMAYTSNTTGSSDANMMVTKNYTNTNFRQLTNSPPSSTDVWSMGVVTTMAKPAMQRESRVTEAEIVGGAEQSAQVVFVEKNTAIKNGGLNHASA